MYVLQKHWKLHHLVKSWIIFFWLVIVTIWFRQCRSTNLYRIECVECLVIRATNSYVSRRLENFVPVKITSHFSVPHFFWKSHRHMGFFCYCSQLSSNDLQSVVQLQLNTFVNFVKKIIEEDCWDAMDRGTGSRLLHSVGSPFIPAGWQ